ncbi:hypothetical protein SDC9_116772 [bioreactor metagenome]|uniref:Uncharacterized protein n=1 Tax=bioreactor metagenome TaxID=1076179 RepID=A0A645C796_9ZZZZ
MHLRQVRKLVRRGHSVGKDIDSDVDPIFFEGVNQIVEFIQLLRNDTAGIGRIVAIHHIAVEVMDSDCVITDPGQSFGDHVALGFFHIQRPIHEVRTVKANRVILFLELKMSGFIDPDMAVFSCWRIQQE